MWSINEVRKTNKTTNQQATQISQQTGQRQQTRKQKTNAANFLPDIQQMQVRKADN